MARGQEAQAPFSFDPRNGVKADGPAFGDGAASGRITEQPERAVGPGGHARLTWAGGARGLDRRLEAPFVIVERESGGRWRRVDDDLGMNVVWTIDDASNYTARWHVPSTARNGTYRLVIWANRYRLTSQPFLVSRDMKPNDARPGDPIARFIPFTAG